MMRNEHQNSTRVLLDPDSLTVAAIERWRNCGRPRRLFHLDKSPGGTKIASAFKVIRICQGAAVIQVGNQGPIHLNLVVVNGGGGILFIQGDSNTLVSGSLQR